MGRPCVSALDTRLFQMHAKRPCSGIEAAVSSVPRHFSSALPWATALGASGHALAALCFDIGGVGPSGGLLRAHSRKLTPRAAGRLLCPVYVASLSGLHEPSLAHW